MGAMLAGYVGAILTISVYAAYCWFENRRREKIDSNTRGARIHTDTDFKDLTDRENVHFRYVW